MMSNTIRVSPCVHSLQQSRRPRCCSSTGFLQNPQSFSISHGKATPLLRSSLVLQKKRIDGIRRTVETRSSISSVEGSLDSPVSVELNIISSEEQFDRVIAEAQQLEESLIVVWTAIWCRKCVYLKPKLEHLAADYYPRVRFYCIDVNTVPQKLVTRAGVTKMPTVQLWKDCKKQAEVIGGHKAYLVVNEVREMIDNECSL